MYLVICCHHLSFNSLLPRVLHILKPAPCLTQLVSGRTRLPRLQGTQKGMLQRPPLPNPVMSSPEPPRKAVAFNVESTVRYIEKSHRPNMAKQLFETFDGHELTDTMLKEAAKLFNENYGIWGEDPTNPRPIPKPGMSHKTTNVLNTFSDTKG